MVTAPRQSRALFSACDVIHLQKIEKGEKCTIRFENVLFMILCCRFTHKNTFYFHLFRVSLLIFKMKMSTTIVIWCVPLSFSSNRCFLVCKHLNERIGQYETTYADTQNARCATTCVPKFRHTVITIIR